MLLNGFAAPSGLSVLQAIFVELRFGRSSVRRRTSGTGKGKAGPLWEGEATEGARLDD
jgi:hypothetical protein